MDGHGWRRPCPCTAVAVEGVSNPFEDGQELPTRPETCILDCRVLCDACKQCGVGSAEEIRCSAELGGLGLRSFLLEASAT